MLQRRVFWALRGHRGVRRGGTSEQIPVVKLSLVWENVGVGNPIVPIDQIEDTASRMQPGMATVVRFADAGHGVGGQPTVIDVVRDFVVRD
jgi:hypothetical protein